MLSRRSLLPLLAAAAHPLPAQRRPPNIILVMTDDQGYGDLSCHGNPILRTPNIDRLHGESVRFTDFQVSPTCAPTRSSLLTGRHEFKNGVSHTINERERMALSSTTIAQVLRQAGYSTGIFGKWHLGDAPEYQPGQRGFDEVFIHGCGGIGQKYPGTCADAPGNTYFGPTLLHNGRFVKTTGYCTDEFFAQSLRWMDSRRQTRQPFFAYITPNAPHDPLQCPEAYIAKYRAATQNENLARFYGMIENIDDNMGRLLSRLKDWQLERDTLLLFLTDNGSITGAKAYNAGMRGAKNTVYRGGTRVPAFFRWPGVYAPGDVNRLAAHLDLFPTLAEIAGAKPPANLSLDGRSLLPLLQRPDAAWPDRYLFTHQGRWPKGKAAQSKYANCRVRSQRFSLINSDRGENGWELYDLETDPGETTSIAATHPDIVKSMAAAYDAWWKEVLPLLVNEDAVPPAVSPYWSLYQQQMGRLPVL